MTVPEAAKVLGVSRQRVWKLVKQGKIGAVKVGRDWHIDRAALDAFIRDRDRKKK